MAGALDETRKRHAWPRWAQGQTAHRGPEAAMTGVAEGPGQATTSGHAEPLATQRHLPAGGAGLTPFLEGTVL